MAVTLNSGILALIAPGASTLADAYTPPANVVASVAVSVANRSTSPANIRISVRKGGGSPFYLAYDEPLSPAAMGQNSWQLRAIVLGPSDTLQVYSSSGNTDFVVSGFEEPANNLALD